ncbi:hypothetical protein GT016_27985 [Streptomyces sp. SID3915]|nr:hypothetical protein [Streptomyces sp. SID3915]
MTPDGGRSAVFVGPRVLNSTLGAAVSPTALAGGDSYSGILDVARDLARPAATHQRCSRALPHASGIPQRMTGQPFPRDDVRKRKSRTVAKLRIYMARH